MLNIFLGGILYESKDMSLIVHLKEYKTYIVISRFLDITYQLTLTRELLLMKKSRKNKVLSKKAFL